MSASLYEQLQRASGTIVSSGKACRDKLANGLIYVVIASDIVAATLLVLFKLVFLAVAVVGANFVIVPIYLMLNQLERETGAL